MIDAVPNNEKRLAVFRMVLGTAQVMGATITLVFLVETGASVLTYTAAGTTLGLVIASRVIFKKRE